MIDLVAQLDDWMKCQTKCMAGFQARLHPGGIKSCGARTAVWHIARRTLRTLKDDWAHRKRNSDQQKINIMEYGHIMKYHGHIMDIS